MQILSSINLQATRKQLYRKWTLPETPPSNLIKTVMNNYINKNSNSNSDNFFINWPISQSLPLPKNSPCLINILNSQSINGSCLTNIPKYIPNKKKKKKIVCRLYLDCYLSSNKCQTSNKHRTFGYPHWNKCLPLISVSPIISATPLNTMVTRLVTILY